MHSNIRNTVKPSEYSALHRPLVPRHVTATEPPTDFQHFLETTPDDDIMWNPVLDRESINTNLQKFNRQHFRAASISSCGHGTIHQKVTYSSLAPAAKTILKVKIPSAWYKNTPLLIEVLLSFSIPDKQKDAKPIDTVFTTNDVKYGIRKWKEKSSTSPLGRHLGHYKALIQDETLLNCITKFLNIVIKKGLTIHR